MSQVKDDMIEYLSRAEIDRLVERIAEEIDRDYRDQEVILICPLRGSVLFAADLARRLTIPFQIDFVALESSNNKGAIFLAKDVSLNITNKNLIICEEIIDVGRKLSFLISRLMAAYPASLNVATLLDKPARRELPVTPNYVGKTIEDRFVIGYGMDNDELGRNYANIYLPKN